MSSNSQPVKTIRRSKTIIAVDIQNTNQAVGDGLQLLCDQAVAILDTQAPTKRLRKSLLDTAHSIVDLQNSVVDDITNLIPNECTKYSLKRIHSENRQETKTLPDEIAPRPNMRTRAFQVGDTMIPLPQNHIQYKAPEACSILLHIESTLKPNTRNTSVIYRRGGF